nr:MAG TPA: hypothetical protein [Caudoviricetes sp.]
MLNPMQLMGMLTRAQNPMEILNQMAGNNPVFGRGLQMGKGKSVSELQGIAENLARQRGVNLNDFLYQMGFRR